MIPEVEEIFKEDGTVEMKRNKKSYIPNGTRWKNLISNYAACVKYSSSKNYILTEYILPITEYIIPISDLKTIQMKINFFTSTAGIFKQILNTVALLHEREFFDDDPTLISYQSSQMILENLDLDQFGFREAGRIMPGSIPVTRVVIRNPLNVVSNMKAEQI